jgi:hypothetical protein
MFSNDSKIQIAVLQERFKAHEQIIDKVDTAIQTLSETNQNICKMLAVHDERIDYGNKTKDNLITRVEKVETKVEGLSNFKWQIAGAVGLAVFLIGILNAFIPKLIGNNLLTLPPSSAKIERTK